MTKNLPCSFLGYLVEPPAGTTHAPFAFVASLLCLPTKLRWPASMERLVQVTSWERKNWTASNRPDEQAQRCVVPMLHTDNHTSILQLTFSEALKAKQSCVQWTAGTCIKLKGNVTPPVISSTTSTA